MRSVAVKSILAVIFLTVAVQTTLAQQKDEWHRVITGPGFNIDISESSLKLEPNRVISAKFKTTLSTSEKIGGKSDLKYKTRLETIRFDSKERRYSISETALLDPSGKVVLSSSSNEWKPIKGTASQLYQRALTLPPFGSWKVNTYWYADGKPAAIEDPPDLRKLIGASLWLTFDNVQLAGENCARPSFELKSISDEEFLKRTGSSFKSIGIEARKVDSVSMRCETSGSNLEQTFFLLFPDGKLLLLWEGVFLELESPSGGWGTSLLKLITN